MSLEPRHSTCTVKFPSLLTIWSCIIVQQSQPTLTELFLQDCTEIHTAQQYKYWRAMHGSWISKMEKCRKWIQPSYRQEPCMCSITRVQIVFILSIDV